MPLSFNWYAQEIGLFNLVFIISKKYFTLFIYEKLFFFTTHKLCPEIVNFIGLVFHVVSSYFEIISQTAKMAHLLTSERSYSLNANYRTSKKFQKEVPKSYHEF